MDGLPKWCWKENDVDNDYSTFALHDDDGWFISQYYTIYNIHKQVQIIT